MVSWILISQSNPAHLTCDPQTRDSLGASLCVGSGKSSSASETGFSLRNEVGCVTGAWPVLESGFDINALIAVGKKCKKCSVTILHWVG